MPSRQYLITPGPTPIPPEVTAAMSAPMMHHRSPDFKELFEHTLAGLRRVYQTAGDVLVLAGSGTAGMESAVLNLSAPGDRVVVASAGNFGERWAEMCERHSVSCEHIALEWGERLDPEAIGVAAAGASAVYVTQSETSTGVVHDVRGIAEAVRPTGAALVVDAVSSLGGVDLRTDEWGVDVVVSGSQKALMTPPGLAFVSVSERAWQLARRTPTESLYLDWQTAADAQAKGTTAFTPPVSLLFGLRAALEVIEQRGLEPTFAHNRRLAEATRAGVKALGLPLFSPDDTTSAMVTAFSMPPGLDGQVVYSTLRDRHGIVLAGGQGRLRGKIMRIGHMGYMNEFDIITAMAGLELTLRELGFSPPAPGAGTTAALQVFAGG